MSYLALYDISEAMKTHFNKYLNSLLNNIKKFLLIPNSGKMKKISLKLIKCAILSCDSDNTVKEVFNFLSQPIIECLKNAIENENLKIIRSTLKGLTNAFNEITNKIVFTESFIKALFEQFHNCCQTIDKIKNEEMGKILNEKLDEDEQNEIFDDYDYLSEIERRVMETSGILFKLFGSSLTEIVVRSIHDSFMNNWNANLNRKKFTSDQDILSAICYFDDLIEYGDKAAVNLLIPVFLQNTLDYLTNNEDILQSIVFGLGLICIKLSKEEFLKYKEKIVKYIAMLMQREVNDNNELTYDNAVSAMGKFLIYQCENDDNTLTMTKQFIKLLPLKNDVDEGKYIKLPPKDCSTLPFCRRNIVCGGSRSSSCCSQRVY